MLWARGKEAQENIIGEAEVDVRKKSGEGEGNVRGNCERGGRRRKKTLWERAKEARENIMWARGKDERENIVGEGKGGAMKLRERGEEEKANLVGEWKEGVRKHYVGEGERGERKNR